jgi:DNA-binding NtrC family response regulator
MNDTAQILIVDDEPNVRLVFHTALDKPEYAITTARDGAEALRLLGEEPFDLVLLDLKMPLTGGMEVLESLRDAGCDVPVVVITAHGGVTNAVEAMKLGAIDFLPKPLKPVALRQVVAEVLARHPRSEPEPAPAGPERHDLLTSAKRALNHRLFYRAKGLLQEAIKERPDSAEPWYLLGVLHEVEQKPAAAKEAYQAALRIDPEYEPAKFHLMKFQRST